MGGQAQGPSARSVKPPNSGFRSLSTPTCVLPPTVGMGGANPNLRGRGVAPLLFSSLRCPGQYSRICLLQIVSHTSCPAFHPPAQAWHSATTRDRALPTWGTCWVLPPFRRGREQPSLSRSCWEVLAWCCRGALQPMGTEEVGRQAAVTLPGTGGSSGGPEHAGRRPARGLRGRSLRRRRRSRRSATGGPLLTRATEEPLAPRLLPRIPDRQHDRCAAPSLLLH